MPNQRIYTGMHGEKVKMGPPTHDPTYDRVKNQIDTTTLPQPNYARQVGATVKNYAHSLVDGMKSGELTVEDAEARLQKAQKSGMPEY